MKKTIRKVLALPKTYHADKAIALLKDGDYLIGDIPYHCQFATPELTKDILEKKGQEQLSASAPYKTLSNLLGDGNIYSSPEANANYLGLSPETINKTYNSDLKLMHDKFLANPTFDNAHELQSQLGSEVRDFDKMRARLGKLPQTERNLQDTYKFARTNLQEDIDSFLTNKNPAFMSANNEIIIRKQMNTKYTVIHNDVDCGEIGVLADEVSLEEAVEIAKKYEIDCADEGMPVEYGTRFE